MSTPAATYYDLLRVSRRASPDGVRAAYRRLAQQYHPDKRPGNADAERVMAALNEAYAVLSDPERRASYDRRILEAKALRQRRRQEMLARLEHPGAAWPWYLLFATIAFSVSAIGITVYKNYVPGASSAAVVSASSSSPRAGASPSAPALKLLGR